MSGKVWKEAVREAPGVYKVPPDGRVVKTMLGRWWRVYDGGDLRDTVPTLRAGLALLAKRRAAA